MNLEEQLLKEWNEALKPSVTNSKVTVYKGNNYARLRAILCYFYSPVRTLLTELEHAMKKYEGNKKQHSDRILAIRNLLFEKWRITTVIDENGGITFGYQIEEDIQNLSHSRSVQTYDLEHFKEEVERGIDLDDDMERFQSGYALVSIKLTDDDKMILSDLIQTMSTLRNKRGITPIKSQRQIQLEKGNAKGFINYQFEDVYIIQLAFKGKSNEEIANDIKSKLDPEEISKRLWELLSDINSHNLDWVKEKKILQKSRRKSK